MGAASAPVFTASAKKTKSNLPRSAVRTARAIGSKLSLCAWAPGIRHPATWPPTPCESEPRCIFPCMIFPPSLLLMVLERLRQELSRSRILRTCQHVARRPGLDDDAVGHDGGNVGDL